ncbi:MAG: OmpA family protein [Sandaracinaceae bacterium]|nr:OmpA family protein [Sandaracinaceae bacterium]
MSSRASATSCAPATSRPRPPSPPCARPRTRCALASPPSSRAARPACAATPRRSPSRSTSASLFPPGASELNERGLEVLARVAQSLASLPDRVVRIEGHTDSTPLTGANAERFPTNWELSTARATSVVRFLEQQGIAGERLAAVGYGAHHPVADNGTAIGRRRNRRIEIVVARRTVSTETRGELMGSGGDRAAR